MNAMVILHIIFFVLCIFYLAYRFQVRPVETMPVFLCMLILVLYALAMMRHLSWIDGVEAASVLLFAVWLVGRGKEGRKEFAGVCIENVTHPSFIIAVFLLIVIGVCTLDKVVAWWDDINFWAADVKSLYYIDGFAGKYGNVAPDFGDYPPAAQLMKWWFLHWMPGTFREGLAFVGYYTMNMVFFLPLIRRLKGRNIPVMFALSAALWFFPSIAEVYGYEGFCADLTMACIYGGFLFAVTDDKTYSEVFYYGRLALYLSVLVLVKSIGFVWALFGIIFFFLYRRWGQDGVKYEKSRLSTLTRKIWTWLVVAMPVLVGGSWMAFCLLMRRITKTTTTAVRYLTTDGYGISVYRSEFAKAFVKAFTLLPLHKEKSIVFDLTPLSFYLCICLLVVILYKSRILSKRTGKIILWFSMISGVVFYAVIFVAHITIFADEIQYLEPFAMTASIERYGAPFTIGSLFFLSSLWIENGEHFFESDKLPAFVRRYGVYLSFILLVALTAGWRAGYDGLVGYRTDKSVKLAERASMIGEDEEMFLHAIDGFDIKSGARVCYIRRGDVPRWVNNTYLSYEASPLSVVYKGINLADAPTDWMVQEIRASHASYLYAEETDADVGVVFDELMQEGVFSCGVLYRIADDGTNMKLTQVSY